MIVLALAAAGGIGALARFWLDNFTRSVTDFEFPLGTMMINVTGSFTLGVITGLVLFHGAPTAFERIAGTGFCGGYTTFSTASFETVRLVQEGKTRHALVNALGTVALTLTAAGLGLALASL
jgi:CrcB protein